MKQTLTTEQLRARAESLGLDFFIERRAGIWVKEWLNDGCTSATAEEVMMWSMLANRETNPFGYVYTSKDGVAVNFGYELPFMPEKWNVTPVYTAPPAPAVPDEAKVGEMPFLGNGEPVYVRGWNDCRAAMLAQPVSSGCTLPEGYTQGIKDGLEWAARTVEANHPNTSDWLYDDRDDLAKAIRKGPDMLAAAPGES